MLSCIMQVRQKIDSLKEEHSNLTNQLTLFPAVTTPSSTASSSVINIHDVGQLSSELHVPHISEPDAISARATVCDEQYYYAIALEASELKVSKAHWNPPPPI